ncbi:MAG: glycosyltransferase family 4 protein [Candidatus Hodarchaeota archaeon]
MAFLKKSTIAFISQVRQENFDVLIGKGFSEAFFWRETFKRMIFICYSTTGDFLYRKIYNNCYLIAIPFTLSPSAFKSIANLFNNYLKLYVFLKKLSKVVKIDIIRMENTLLAGPPTFLHSKKEKIPLLIWLGGNERKALLSKYKKNIFTLLLSKLLVLYEIIILKSANFVFPVTEELFELTEKRNIKNKFLSPNYVNLEKFKDKKPETTSNSNNKIKILFVGRFEKEKGVKLLIKAFKILLEKNANLELIMAGDGSLRGWIEDYLYKYKIKNVNLLGWIHHDNLPDIYNSADVFVLPSYTEGSPASLIEAMSCGTASIATAVGDTQKIIKNEYNGILIPPGNIKKLIEAIQNLLDQANLLDKFSKNGRSSIINYTKSYYKIHRYVFKKVLKIYNA